MRLLILILASLFTLNAFAQNKDLGFKNESELGYLVVGGNTKSEALSAKTALGYNWEWDLLKFTAHYFYSTGQVANKNSEIAKNWSSNLRYERVITPDVFNIFAGVGISGDRFRGIDKALSFDLGGKYFFYKTDMTQWFGEAGYRMIQETFYPALNSTTNHFLRLFTQADHKYSESLSVGFWVEYLPALTEVDFGAPTGKVPASKNYRVNFSPYLLAVLNDTFSVKFAYEGQYRGTPAVGFTENLDFRHTTTLIAKF